MESQFQQMAEQSKQPPAQPNQPAQSATPAAPTQPQGAAQPQQPAQDLTSQFSQMEQAENPTPTTTAAQAAQTSANDNNSEAAQELARKQSVGNHGWLARAWEHIGEPLLDNVLPDGMKTADLIKAAAFEKMYNEAYIPGVNDFNTKAMTHFEPAEKAIAGLGPKEKDGAIKKRIRQFLIDHASSIDATANAANTFAAGATRDAADMGAGYTSLLSLATLGLGKVGRVGTVLSPLVGTAFGLQGLGQAGEGAQKLARTTTWENLKHGYLDPEALQETLGGTGQAVLGATAPVHGASDLTDFAREKARPVMETVGGQEVPVRAKGAVAEAVQKGVDASVNDAATAKTQAAVQKGIGNVVGEGVGSEAQTKVANQDRLGIRSHAADLKEAATEAMDELNRQSNGDYEDAKSMMEKSQRDFTTKGREDYNTAKALHDDIIEQHRQSMADAGFDVDEMKGSYRKAIALEKIATRMESATGPLEGGSGYEVKGDRLAKIIDDMRKVPGHENPSLSKNLFERAGLTEDHINALADLADTLREQQETPKFGSLTKLAAKAIAVAATTHSVGAAGLTGLFEGLTGEKAGEVVGSKVMTKLFGDALTSEPLAKQLNAAMKGGPAALSTWDKFQQAVKTVVERAKSVDLGGEEGAVGAAVKRRNAGQPLESKFSRGVSPATPINESPLEGMKVNKRENGDWEFNHPNGTSQMVLHPEADPRPGYEGKTQLRQTGISAVDAPGAGQEMMDDAVARMKQGENFSRVISDHPDLRSPENEGHWSKLARRGHDVRTEPATDSFGNSFTDTNGEEGKSYSIAKEKTAFKPVAAEDYAAAVKANPQAATLTDPEALKRNASFTDGNGVYYSISPEGDLQGVVNNSGKPGALKRVMPEAIARGAKTLDAWDIYLPEQYEKYGFERTKKVPYDVKEYGEPSEELKDSWRQQGWKDSQPYPSVQYMKLKGTSGLPTVESLKAKYGTTNDVLKAGFIAPSGDMIPLTGEHDHMLGGKTTEDTREQFIKDTGTIRTRYRMTRAGEEQVFSLPNEITEDQQRRILDAANKLKNGNVVLETVDGKNHQTIEMSTGAKVQAALDKLVKVSSPNEASNAEGSEIATRRPTSTKVDATNAPGQYADMAGVEAASKAGPGRGSQSSASVPTAGGAKNLPEWDGEGKIANFPGREPQGRISTIRQVDINKVRPTEKPNASVVANVKNALLHDDGKEIPAIMTEENSDGTYDVTDGHSRLEAARQAGYDKVPIRVYTHPEDIESVYKSVRNARGVKKAKGVPSKPYSEWTQEEKNRDWAIRSKLPIDAQDRVTLYHATPEHNSASVAKNGLLPNSFLTDDIDTAIHQASRSGERKEPHHVYEAKVPLGSFHGGTWAQTIDHLHPSNLKRIR